MEAACVRKADMDKVGVTVKFGRNETIYSKGEEARYSYKVIEGAVRLSRIFADGRRQIVNFFLPDETFGIELSEEYTSTAEAVGDVVALRCPRLCIAQLTEGDPDISQKRLAMLSKSLSAAERHVAMLGHQSAKERVASFFLALEMAAAHGNRAYARSAAEPPGYCRLSRADHRNHLPRPERAEAPADHRGAEPQADRDPRPCRPEGDCRGRLLSARAYRPLIDKAQY